MRTTAEKFIIEVIKFLAGCFRLFHILESFLLYKSYMLFRKYFQACAVCKMYFPPTNWLCSLCWKALEREYLYSNTLYRVERTLPHLRLLDWHKDNQKLIKNLIDSLKQGGPSFVFKRLGLEMSSRFRYFPLWDKNTFPLFIPAPSKSKNKDHAFMLAQALSFYFGGDIKNLLKRGDENSSQKQKSKRKRADIQIAKEGSLPTKKIFVFVDDVLTTGSTALASFKALNKPKNFFVFTLVWRRPVQTRLFE